VALQEAPAAGEPEIDLASLPPIDSIALGTDIRPFLRRGVPPELTREALRRAWTTDPAIRDFIEVAENQWDFATGAGIPGFGPLEIGEEELRRRIAEIMGDPAPSDAEGPPAPEAAAAPIASVGPVPGDAKSEQPEPKPSALAAAGDDIVRRSIDAKPAQQRDEARPANTVDRSRRHGTALPR
jgi:hypothetical protein